MAAGVTFPHPSLRVRWWLVGATAAAMLVCGSAFGTLVFPLGYALTAAWMLWRHDRDHGRH